MADVDSYKFSADLIAYLYQNYERARLVNDLPFRMEYEIPETFDRRIGNIQIQVNEILREDLQVVYQQNFWRACRSIITIRAYIMRVCRKLSKKFRRMRKVYYLGFLAVATELNLFCFQQGCYRHAFFLAECIGEVLESTVLKKFRVDERAVKFEQLLNRCVNMLDPANENLDSNIKKIKLLGIYFKITEEFRYKRKTRQLEFSLAKVQEESDSSTHSEEGSEEDAESDTSSGDEAKCEASSSKEDPFAQEDMEATLFAAAKPVNTNACNVCYEENCKKYLEEFVRKYAAGEMKRVPQAVP